MKNIDFLKRNFVLLIVLCSILISCTSENQKKESFDYPLAFPIQNRILKTDHVFMTSRKTINKKKRKFGA